MESARLIKTARRVDEKIDSGSLSTLRLQRSSLQASHCPYYGWVFRRHEHDALEFTDGAVEPAPVNVGWNPVPQGLPEARVLLSCYCRVYSGGNEHLVLLKSPFGLSSRARGRLFHRSAGPRKSATQQWLRVRTFADR